VYIVKTVGVARGSGYVATEVIRLNCLTLISSGTSKVPGACSEVEWCNACFPSHSQPSLLSLVTSRDEKPQRTRVMREDLFNYHKH
jgi:hypothetical protein